MVTIIQYPPKNSILFSSTSCRITNCAEKYYIPLDFKLTSSLPSFEASVAKIISKFKTLEIHVSNAFTEKGFNMVD